MKTANNDTFTSQQETFCNEIAKILDAVGNLNYRLIDFPESKGNGPWFEFNIQTNSLFDLRVRLSVYQDCFYINCNESEVRVEGATYFYEFEPWLDDSKAMVNTLISHDLCIRIRKTFFGRKTGAIWFEWEDGGTWSGDYKSCIGAGQGFEYANWYER